MPSSDQTHEPYANRVDAPQPHGAAATEALSARAGLPSGSGRRLLSRVMAELSVTFATIVSLLPRGMLIATVAAVPAQGIARNHPRVVDRMDRASLRLMSARRPIRLSDQPSAGHRRAVEPVLGRAMGGQLEDALVIAVDSPVVAGYQGALLAARASGEGPFGDEEVRKLATLAAEFSRDRASEIGARLVQRHTRADWVRAIRMLAPHRGAAIFDTDGKLLHPRAADGEPVTEIDPSLYRQMSDTARELAGARHAVITRWMGRAASGVLVPYRVVRHGPASSDGVAPELAEETTIWFSRTPTPTEFLSIDPADLVSEPDMARMLPAMRFMRESFASMPSLDQIARQVHLSPFHFHRRFTDLLGVTPKHFLLDCQIEQAQIELLAGRLSLAEIAASCGFSHQSHFTSRFKQATGLTPVQWRGRATAG